ncbi:glucose dehydrogenase [FAD, quinone]-like [Amphiura filiformis]|uniref:glucose dehydrogenase [FAD, quinone]-like n=1 Tax=Amphiura filiformis TaxID=82378 RepID=UPI003B21DD80
MASQGRAYYDYIVVGAGTAGCIVASRLTEDPRISVLLLEAGSSDVNDFRVKNPTQILSCIGSEIDWKYKTVPQKNALKGYKNNVCDWPRGKVLGGSSSINGMAWVRGHYADYDSWAKQGCTGWG